MRDVPLRHIPHDPATPRTSGAQSHRIAFHVFWMQFIATVVRATVSRCGNESVIATGPTGHGNTTAERVAPASPTWPSQGRCVPPTPINSPGRLASAGPLDPATCVPSFRVPRVIAVHRSAQDAKRTPTPDRRSCPSALAIGSSSSAAVRWRPARRKPRNGGANAGKPGAAKPRVTSRAARTMCRRGSVHAWG